MNLFILMWSAYSILLMREETISIANYIVNVAEIGIAASVISFILAFIIAIKRNENKMLWWLFDGYLVPAFTPSDAKEFLKSNILKLLVYLIFFGTLFITGVKIL